MSLPAGTRLGPYEILAPLGAGGMGEVFRARDTRLDRLVAIKTSSERFSERFQREAQAIASLNHPHICTLHDVGPDYLVMELIEGQPLKGPLPVTEALKLAIQIAEALTEAHRRGIIHRDLKPANILIAKSGAKVLDFGLAKLSAPSLSSSGDALAATLTQRVLTREGAILGTPQYMAPEQLEGREADARTDIFAFGLLLYEMLTGQPAFQGKSQASLIAAILAADPQPVTAFQPSVPPSLDRLIRTCLTKDPDERRQNMHDVLLELRWIAESLSQASLSGLSNPSLQLPAPAPKSRWSRAWLAGSLGALGTVALLSVAAFTYFRSQPTAPEPVLSRFEVLLPDNVHMGSSDSPAMSPDGRSIVVPAAAADGTRMLWLRRLDSLNFVALPGTQGAGGNPSWSPDSRSLLFTSQNRLRRLDLNGGTPIDLAPAGLNTRSTWSDNGVVLYSTQSAIYSVPASGGTVTPLPRYAAKPNEGFYNPSFLIGSQQFLVNSFGSASARGLLLASLDGKEPLKILDRTATVRPVAPDMLLLDRQRTLLAQSFDPQTGRLAEDVTPLATDLQVLQSGALFSASRNGSLAYRATSANGLMHLASYGRDGRRLSEIGPPKPYLQFQVSPDARRLTAQTTDLESNSLALWEMNLSSGILSPLVPPAARLDNAVWSPDSREVIFPAAVSGLRDLYRKTVGTDQQTLVLKTAEEKFPEQWLPDNSLLFLNTNGKKFYRLPLTPNAQPELLLETTYNKDEPDVSPDGRWVVYSTEETGRWEIYLASFPKFEQRRQISSGGGMQPKWNKDGKEIFYLSPDANLMRVPVLNAATAETSAPQVLFRTPIPIFPTRDQYAVLDNGRRFLLIEPLETGRESITVILNWPLLLSNKK